MATSATADLVTILLGYNDLDDLALMHNGQRWLITNKLFTHVDPSWADISLR